MAEYRFNKEEHLHQLNVDGEWKDLTGTSSVVDVLYKPLSWWASGKAMEIFGWQNSKNVPVEEIRESARSALSALQGMELNAYLKLLEKGYRAHSTSLKKSADKGTDLHDELEKFVKTSMGLAKHKEFDPQIKPFQEWANKEVKRFLWSEANTFSKILFVGGKTDTGAEMNDGSFAVIDFKSSKEAYPAQFVQTGGYALQIEENGLWNEKGTINKKLDKQITKLIIVPFGAKVVVPEIRPAEPYKEGFKHAVALYRLLGLDKRIKNNQ